MKMFVTILGSALIVAASVQFAAAAQRHHDKPDRVVVRQQPNTINSYAAWPAPAARPVRTATPRAITPAATRRPPVTNADKTQIRACAHKLVGTNAGITMSAFRSKADVGGAYLPVR